MSSKFAFVTKGYVPGLEVADTDVVITSFVVSVIGILVEL
jgi:hypothetical protein